MNQEENGLKFEITPSEIKEAIVNDVQSILKSKFAEHKTNLEGQIDRFFRKNYSKADTNSPMEDALDWSLELIYRDAMSKALVELDFENLVKEKIKSILSDPSFLQKMAEEKVRKALGV